MSDTVPNNLITEVCAINELNHDSNTDILLAMSLIKVKQDKDAKLQLLLNQDKYKSNFGILTFRAFDMHTFNGYHKVFKTESLIGTTITSIILESHEHEHAIPSHRYSDGKECNTH
jgi:hypothetical protein